ncbi:hypothetical protein B0H14DRAFT_2617034 [Mycena olivaceomarginata]|nr:hypothetical protein B0H14DRAFT_2617034 [Mycena olivaceomarginata]
MAGVVVPSCESGKDHGASINGRCGRSQLWEWEGPWYYHKWQVVAIPICNWECPHDHACLPYICMWDVPPYMSGDMQRDSSAICQEMCGDLWDESKWKSRVRKITHWLAAVTGETLMVREAKFGVVYTFIGARALEVDHGAKSPEEVPFIERFQGMIVRIKLCASLYCTSIPKVGAWMRYNTPCTARYQAWTGPPIRTAGWYPRMIVRIKLCASLYCTLIPKQDIRPGLGPPFVLRDGAQTQTICKAAKACKGFQIHPFAAQYMQKCTQYCNFFGPCDVTPWEIPHQKWEAQMDNMGSPDMHTWASHTVPTPAVPAAPKLLASEVKIHKSEEVDIPAMVASSRIRLGKTPYEFQKQFFSNVMQGHDVVLDIGVMEAARTPRTAITMAQRFWPNAEREESALKVVENFLSRID